jgi:hypothetical protein
MHLLHQILVLLHLIGFAALFGGWFVQLRSAHPEVNAAMLHGAWTQLITGILLVGVLDSGLDPAVESDVNHVKIAIKLVLTLVVVVLAAKNRKFESIPKGLWWLIGAMTLLNAALAVLWQ